MNIFKWIINENKSIFLTEESGSVRPFIYDYSMGERIYSSGQSAQGEVPDYNAIRDIVDTMSEADYDGAFNAMLELKNSDDDGKTCSFRPYSFYYNIDDSSGGYDKFGILEYGCWCNIEMLGSDENPSIDFNLQKTDKTRQYEIDFKIPRTFEGISFFLNPSTVNFLYENIETEKDNENVSIYLYRGNRRVVPDTVELSWECISGDTSSEDIITLSSDKGSFNIKPAMVNDFTTCKVDVTVTYKFKNGDVEETFTGTRALYYNKVYLILSSYVADGDAYSEITMSPDEFSMMVEDLLRLATTKYNQTCNAITFNAKNAFEKMNTSLEIISDTIRLGVDNEISGLTADYERTASQKKMYFKNVADGYDVAMESDADSAMVRMENIKRGHLSETMDSAGDSLTEISDTINGLGARYHSGLDGFNSTVYDYTNSSYTEYNHTYNSVSMAAYNAISGFSAEIVLSGETAAAMVKDATGNSASIAIDLDSINSQVKDIDGNLTEILQSVTNEQGLLEVKVQNASGSVVGIEIRPNQITLVNKYNTFSGLTNINNKVIINPDGTLLATDAEINGNIKRGVCVTPQVDGYGEALYNENYGQKENPSGFASFSGITYLNFEIGDGLYVVGHEIETKGYFNAYPVQKKTIFNLEYGDGRYEILLPIDPEYIGTRIKIVSLPIVNANKQPNYKSETAVNIRCGCVSNFNLYAVNSLAATSSSNTLDNGSEAYLSTDGVSDDSYYYPYERQYKCVVGKDAGCIGGCYGTNKVPLSEIMLQTNIEVAETDSIELIGVPSSTAAYTSEHKFEINCGVPVFKDGDVVKIGENDSIKMVYLTKWVITNLNGFKIATV